MSRFDRDAYLRLVRGQSHGLGPFLARMALGLIALVYGRIIAFRNLSFDRGWRRSQHAKVPVVSVGNLTLGGTGKTPLVEWVARWFRGRGVRVTVISRGYGQSEGLNDEGRVLSDNLPDVPQLQDADRVALAAIAVDELEADLIVLDDGFQHRRLARDVDLVLLDALDPFGLGRLFPRGLLREPVRSLARAAVVVLSRADLVDSAERAAIRAEAERRSGPLRWVETRHAALDLIDSDGDRSPIESLTERSAAAFCGIGNPEGFRRTLLALCRELVDFRIFPDHHNYSAADTYLLERWARDLGVNLVLTTQKDLVKLRVSTLGPVPLRALRIGLEVTAGSDIMDDVLARLLPDRHRDESLEKEFP